MKSKKIHLPPSLLNELNKVLPSTTLEFCDSWIIPSLSNNGKHHIPEFLIYTVNWLRNRFGCHLSWKLYVSTLIKTRVNIDKKATRNCGRFIDEQSRVVVERLLADLARMKPDPNEEIWYDNVDEWFMGLFVRGWYLLSLIQITDDEKINFKSRFYVRNQLIRIPKVILMISNTGEITILESDMIHSEFRVVRYKLKPSRIKGKRKGSEGYVKRRIGSLASLDLPVHSNKRRKLEFTPDIEEYKKGFGPIKGYKMSGKNALVAWILDNGLSQRRNDTMSAFISSTGSRVESVESNFQIDVSLMWDSETNKIISVNAEHADPKILYNLLICGDGVTGGVQLYTMHCDAFRDPGEATGLELHYRNILNRPAQVTNLVQDPLFGVHSICRPCNNQPLNGIKAMSF